MLKSHPQIFSSGYTASKTYINKPPKLISATISFLIVGRYSSFIINSSDLEICLATWHTYTPQLKLSGCCGQYVAFSNCQSISGENWFGWELIGWELCAGGNCE